MVQKFPTVTNLVEIGYSGQNKAKASLLLLTFLRCDSKTCSLWGLTLTQHGQSDHFGRRTDTGDHAIIMSCPCHPLPLRMTWIKIIKVTTFGRAISIDFPSIFHGWTHRFPLILHWFSKILGQKSQDFPPKLGASPRWILDNFMDKVIVRISRTIKIFHTFINSYIYNIIYNIYII